MNLRKFYFTLSAVLLAFLFTAGILIINYMNTAVVSDDIEDENNNKGGLLDSFVIRRKPVNILVLGGDKVNGNTDTMMVVNFNPSTMGANIISIPRDTRVKIEGSYHKINYAYPHGGAELAMKTVRELLGIDIKYYIYVDTKVFRNVIDLLGGVKNFEVPVDMHYDDPLQNLHIHIEKGVQDFDGAKAEQFMRFRQPNGSYSKELREYYDGSDLKRIEAQQRFLKELIRQKANPIYFAKVNDVLNEIFKNIETNMTTSDALKMTQNITKFKMENVNFMGTIPGTTYDRSPWYYLCNQEEAAELMKQYFNGTGNFVDFSSGLSQGSSSNTAVKNNTKPAKDVTKNNPSNSDSGVGKTNKPQP
ncbi:hypothetical protein CDQ84_17325 [Clostridium thermosuccinogenes]|uniref:Cell envelope-related transcriptional attenuator domain-containing protein n=2 Tax=Clostridium thermosuccinogenes TaxID=84032 RepID=A0A2K2F929_9CLOT|nr:LCP family protein [Pseudoclostridium thermosuccinogenes]AUS96527.1 hypothetical protein CDO33_08815 [Pseudoclostridium thermosuccinogenes]PNT92813.1 hypothetical protein CDQ83_04440 [Pseudoclostridium thermosuccinogenes]PNT94725.1 hypothetical protein CDQ85_17225 [Pseudoclostridium thermosuccinogenes]PNT95285.1 hypothetical protein CDQ84_17325 [Pseudoclostridium thermosuccinogenes]